MKLAIHLPQQRVLRLAVLLAGVVLLIVIGRQGASAQRPPGWQVGNPIAETLPAASAALQADAAAAGRLAAAFGLTGSPRPAVHQRDLRSGQEFDEVAFISTSGVETALVRLDPITRLPLAIVQLTRPEGFDHPGYDASTAPGRARAIAAQAGLSLPDAGPAVAWDPGLESWRVGWERVVDGVPAPGDGTFVNVFPGGQLASLSRFETPLRPAPGRTITPGDARRSALEWAVGRGVAPLKEFRVEPPALEWRAANDYLTPGGSDAPEAELRLVYRVRLSYTISGDTEPQVLDLYVDAGDGTVVGGAASA